MIKTILILIAALTSFIMNGQEITGQWNGILKVPGAEYRVIFNISKTEKGYSSTMDSPDQGAKGIPVTITNFENSVLKLEIPKAGIVYRGTLNKDNVIVGDFSQGGQSFAMNMSREKIEKEVAKRPQEPLKPYSYYTEEVTFENKIDKNVLAGTLSLPTKEGHFPAVILITGSGAQNRDEEILGHKTFLVLADYLTKKRGIAVLRFDDRGVGKSTGDFKTATTMDFAGDVQAGVDYLKSRKEIDKSKIGLIGHSEGGIIAPIVAGNSKDIDFIVLMAGTGIRGDELILLQQELIGRISGLSDADLQNSKKSNKEAFEIIVKSTNPEQLKIDLSNYIRQSLKEDPNSDKPKDMSEDDYVNLQVKKITSPWFVYLLKFEPSTALKKVKCPVLAINGEKDLQVPADVNIPAIKNALAKGGNKKVTTKVLPNLNHLFQECNTGLPSEYGTIEQTFSPIALEEISSWILVQVK